MQISTIEVRPEGLEKSRPGKKDASDSAGAESAFAAFFADAQQSVHRGPEAKAATHEEAGGADNAAEVSVERPLHEGRPQPANAEGKTDGLDGARRAEAAGVMDSSADATEADGVLAGHGKHVHHKHHVVSHAKPHRAGLTVVKGLLAKPVTSPSGDQPAEPAVPNATEYQADVSVIAKQPNAASLPANTAAPILVAAVGVKHAVGPTPPSVDGDSQTTGDATKAVAAVESSAGVPEADGESVVDAPLVQPKTPAAKPESKANANANAPANSVADSEGAVNAVPAQDETATAALEPEAEGLGLEAESAATPSAVPDPADNPPKAEPQVLRTVTHVTTQDGAVLATRTIETRSEPAPATGQREVVVVERTTVQALPEQMLRGARYLSVNGEQTMRIRLVPESLGEVRLEVIAANGEVSVKLASANAAVREVLQTHAPGLQSAIAQDHAGPVSVTVTADVSSNAWLSGNAQRHSGHHGAPAPQRQAAASYQRPSQPHTALPRREAAHAGNLNLYV